MYFFRFKKIRQFLNLLPMCRRWLVSGGMDGLAAAWDLDAMACSRTFTLLDQPVDCLSVSADARHVAYGGGQEMVPIEAMEPGAVLAGGAWACACTPVCFQGWCVAGIAHEWHSKCR